MNAREVHCKLTDTTVPLHCQSKTCPVLFPKKSVTPNESSLNGKDLEQGRKHCC